MAISTWGMSLSEAVSLSEVQINGLLGAYVERKQFEAKVLLATLGKALKPKDEGISLGGLSAMGFEIEGL